MKFLSALMKALLRILSKLFGSFSWSPPPWLDFFKNFSPNLKAVASRASAAARSSAEKARTVTAGYWKSLPVRATLERVRSNVAALLKGPLKRSAPVLASVLAVLVLILWYAVSRAGAIHVSGTEPGLTKLEDVLRPDPVHVRFSRSASRLDLIGKIAAAGVTISPSIDGEFKWVSDTDLLFTPKGDFHRRPPANASRNFAAVIAPPARPPVFFTSAKSL